MVPNDGESLQTTILIRAGGGSSTSLRGFRLEIVEGPDLGRTLSSTEQRCTLGLHRSCDLVLTDPTVSRFHSELLSDAKQVRIRDLGSSNGTSVNGLQVRDADLKAGCLIKIGRTTLQFTFLETPTRLSLSSRRQFGVLHGRSVPMQLMFARLERVAAADATVLLQGETGTGKSAAARSIHMESKRTKGPFVTADCSSMPGNLLESELFGHEKGAFTGAFGRRIGAFEEADGGTIFLDEIGELPLELQAKLLGVLERRTIRRLGGNREYDVNVRVIAATNRDLRAEVNAGRFRADLYYRLHVVGIEIPPLRERLDDLPLLVASLLSTLDGEPEHLAAMMTPAFCESLVASSWPGNVRELRNYLQQQLVFGEFDLDPPTVSGPGHDADDDTDDTDNAGLDNAAPDKSDDPVRGDDALAGADKLASEMEIDLSLTLSEAKQRVSNAFERRYIAALLKAHSGRVSRAAEAAGVNRSYLYRMLRKHKIQV